MEVIDRYQSIRREVSGIYKEKGSRFLAIGAPVSTSEEALEFVEKVRKAHPKARHHCYAYRIGADKNNYRSNDDGEPSGTGGKPILGQIDAFALSDVVIVVSRYFGGKLLGASGLANAYRQSAEDALKQASIHTIQRKVHYRTHFSYEVMGTLMDALNRYGADIEKQAFDSDKPHLVFSLPISHPAKVLDDIIAHALGLYPEEIRGERKFEQIQIKVESKD
ncbi:MAG: YigZ family protein [Saprospiraceae bacterium]|nr:YigZ family protein [Saprospiraceae bacterium]